MANSPSTCPLTARSAGIIYHKDTRIQLLDLPGIIEGASEGKGRGRQVIAVARSADLILLVVDAGSGKAERQKELLVRELEVVGLRLNQRPPNVVSTAPLHSPLFLRTLFSAPLYTFSRRDWR